MAFTARGLRFVKAIEKYPKEKPNFFDTIHIFNKIKITSATDDHLKATMKVDSSMCNGYHIIHGGFVASLMDVMCLYANVCKTDGRMAVTSNLYVNYFSPVHEGDIVNAEAKTVKGGRSPVMETILYTDDGKIIAKGTAAFKVGNDEFQTATSKILDFDILKSD